MQFVLADGKLKKCRTISESEAASDIRRIYLKFRDDKKFQETFREHFPDGFSKITISFIEFCYQAFEDLNSINSALGKNMGLEEFLFLNEDSKRQLFQEVENKKKKDLDDLMKKCQREIEEENKRQNELHRQLEEANKRFSDALNYGSSAALDRMVKTQLQYEDMMREEHKEKWLSATLHVLVEKYPDMDSSFLYYGIVSFVQMYERKTDKSFDYENPPVDITEVEAFCLMSESEKKTFEEENNFFGDSNSGSKK